MKHTLHSYFYTAQQLKIIHNYLYDFGKVISIYAITQAIMKNEKAFRGKSFWAIYAKVHKVALYNQLGQLDPYRFVGLVYSKSNYSILGLKRKPPMRKPQILKSTVRPNRVSA